MSLGSCLVPSAGESMVPSRYPLPMPSSTFFKPDLTLVLIIPFTAEESWSLFPGVFGCCGWGYWIGEALKKFVKPSLTPPLVRLKRTAVNRALKIQHTGEANGEGSSEDAAPQAAVIMEVRM